MDTTCITHTNGEKSIRYGIDHVVDTYGIEQYSYLDVSPKTIEEIKTTVTEKVQALLSKLF